MSPFAVTMAVLTGYILQTTHNDYMPIFFAVGPLYLIALGIIHLLAPKLRPVEEGALVKPRLFSLGSFLGFGFLGLILGTFFGWGLSLIMRLSGQPQLMLMLYGSGLGIVIGIILGIWLLSVGRSKTVAA